MLFEVAIVENPTKKDAEENGALEKVVLQPTTVVAADQQSAGITAIMDNTEAIKECDKSRLQVLVRPFA